MTDSYKKRLIELGENLLKETKDYVSFYEDYPDIAGQINYLLGFIESLKENDTKTSSPNV
jgi:hypothetical protein